MEAVSSLGFLLCLIYPRHGAQGASNVGTLMHTCRPSSFSRVQLFATLWTVACQAALSMGFSRQKYWSGLPALFQGILPTQGSNPRLLHLLHWQADSLPLCHLGSPDTTRDVSQRPRSIEMHPPWCTEKTQDTN